MNILFLNFQKSLKNMRIFYETNKMYWTLYILFHDFIHYKKKGTETGIPLETFKANSFQFFCR